MKNAGYAFPTTKPYDEAGMTLRDYFAAKALQGCLADASVQTFDNNELAKFCYEMADAMLKVRGE
jgi:hypothetical protein